MSDEYDETETDAIDNDVFGDKIAERTEAFRKLLMSVSCIEDEDLRKEGIAMLKALRGSFKTISGAELSVIAGGKP